MRNPDTRGQFQFIDLFAGIGGFKSALTALGGQSVFSSEWDKFARKTYEAWYGETPDDRDIRTVNPSSIPDHHVLCGGFPCQPFSIAGVSSRNALGRPHGFEDEKQGNLFFTVRDIAAEKRPKLLILENVKNLMRHDQGNTWRVIQEELEANDYSIRAQVLSSAQFVPQRRERIFIVAFDKNQVSTKKIDRFEFPILDPKKGPKLGSILEARPNQKYMLSDGLWAYLQNYAEKHRQQGNGFGYGINDRSSRTRTMSARYYKDGSEILISQEGWKNPRKLTPAEAMKLMGFQRRYAQFFGHKAGFPIVVSDTQAYKQFGNAVVPLVVEAVADRALNVF